MTIIGERKAADTTFVVLHEPFVEGQWQIPEFRRIQQTAEAVAVAVKGQGDSAGRRPCHGGHGRRGAEAPMTLAGDGESFRFKGFAYVRLAPDKVDASGELLA